MMGGVLPLQRPVEIQAHMVRQPEGRFAGIARQYWRIQADNFVYNCIFFRSRPYYHIAFRSGLIIGKTIYLVGARRDIIGGAVDDIVFAIGHLVRFPLQQRVARIQCDDNVVARVPPPLHKGLPVRRVTVGDHRSAFEIGHKGIIRCACDYRPGETGFRRQGSRPFQT
ncbi:MAG: hypothetical protein BWY09_03051 [Candidatus Hydrogenedentes bacterium ADurb.Bin179]|nr:MAG: hypothetical protein BWY09_03051 [Candidatus Hydrogenedentes bacterium ADurb.Bin179]